MTTAPVDAVLLVEGVYLNRPELRQFWDYSIWLEVAPAIALERYAARDGSATDTSTGLGARNEGAQRAYAKESKPRDAATTVIDNSDYERPNLKAHRANLDLPHDQVGTAENRHP